MLIEHYSCVGDSCHPPNLEAGFRNEDHHQKRHEEIEAHERAHFHNSPRYFVSHGLIPWRSLQRRYDGR